MTETSETTAAAMTGGMTDEVAMTVATTDMATAVTTIDAVGGTTGTAGGADGTRTGPADASLGRMTVSYTDMGIS